MADPEYRLPPHVGALADPSVLPDVNVTAPAPATPAQAQTQTVTGTGDQWLRKWTLTVTNEKNTQSIVITTETEGFDLRMKFETKQADATGTPGTAIITVYNLSDATAVSVIREYAKVNLQAGYINGHFGVIFEGTVKQFKKGRESAIDTYLILYCSDADVWQRWGIVNATLPPGWTPDNARDKLIESQFQYGLTKGNVAKDNLTGGTISQRPMTMWGNGVDEIHAYTQTTRQTWSAPNGKIVIQPQTAYAPGDIVVINSGTGMIGMPEVTQDGIELSCLLNPSMFLKQRVQLDNRSFNIRFGPGQGGATEGGLQELRGQAGTDFPGPGPGPQYASTANDGIYCIVVLEHSGDTRGLEWYSHLTCWAIDVSSPAGGGVAGQGEGASV